MEVAEEVRRKGGPAAFKLLARTRLNGLGVAFATKYLFFCSLDHAAPPALILDSQVRGWLASNLGWRLSLAWNVRDYEEYVQAVVEWAGELRIEPGEVEALIFTDAVTVGQWATSAQTGGQVTPSAGDRQVASLAADEVAVLDTLSYLAEAFAALPDDGDPHDAEDFDHLLRHLRRIVLSRRREPPAAADN
jgi:hypothetical protein